MVEAPTSKAKVLHEFMKLRDSFPQNWSLWLPVGGRLDLLSAMHGMVAKFFPTRSCFVIQLGFDKQSSRTKPSYALYCPMQSDVPIPVFVSCHGCRAKASEGLRFRCVDDICKHRVGVSGGCADDENAEFHEDDLETFEAEYDIEEDDDMAEEDAISPEAPNAVQQPSAKRAKAAARNVWLFAQPLSFYDRILCLIRECIEVVKSFPRSSHVFAS